MILVPISRTNPRRHARLVRLVLSLSYPRRALHATMLVDDASRAIVTAARRNLTRAPPGQEHGLASVRVVVEPASLARERRRVEAHPFYDRHDLVHQRRRRVVIAKARNYLAFVALGGTDDLYAAVDWALWLDSDLYRVPPDLVQALRASMKDLVVPACYCRSDEANPVCGRDHIYDRNSWRDTRAAKDLVRGLEQNGTIGRDAVIVRGYDVEQWVATPYQIVGDVVTLAEKPLFLDDLKRRSNGTNTTLVPLDAVGATCILVRADLHRQGLIFPPFPVKHYVESEGLVQVAKYMGVRAYGRIDLRIEHA